MARYNRVTSTVSSLSLLLLCAASFFLSVPAIAQSPGDNVIHLNQAWSQDDREWYYHFSQGSAVLSYDIFLKSRSRRQPRPFPVRAKQPALRPGPRGREPG